MGAMNQDHDLVDEYLDALLAELRGSPRAVRRALAEAEDHLREAAAEARAGGASEEDAQRAAIERFGPPRLVAQRFGQAEDGLSIRARAALATFQVVGIGLAAIGLSGLFVLAMTLLVGSSFVLGFQSIFVGPSAYCRELLHQYPSAGTCGLAYQQAVLLDELRARLVPGAIGILMLGGLWLAARRRPRWRVLLPAGRPAWILIVAGIVVAASLATGQEPGLGVHLAGTLSALAVIAICAASLLIRSRHPTVRAAPR
jgi:hypothetical protein